MTFKRYALPLLAALSLISSALSADDHDGETRFQQELEESDLESLRNFIKAKRSIPLKDKINTLRISAEVHAEWNRYTEKINGRNVRVETIREPTQINEEIYLTGDQIPISHNDFDAEFDLYFDWEVDRTWAHAHVRFDNSMGVDDNDIDCQIDPQGYHGSGSCRNLCLKEAYMGYEIFKCGDRKFVINVGRRGKIGKEFYSELEFDSRMDGIVLIYKDKFPGWAEYHLKWAGFVVDERVDHFAWVVELGLNRICGTGLDFRYSFIDWVHHGINRCFAKFPIGYRFRVSQWALLYNFQQPLLNRPVQLFGAFLWNHSPARYTYVHAGKKKKHIGTQNLGGFLGFQWGEIFKENDWLIKGAAAFCEAQCIPDDDVDMIGTGNFDDYSFTADGRGYTNWIGYAIKGDYAFTDNIVIEVQYDHSWSLDNEIAGTHAFTRFKVETIYHF